MRNMEIQAYQASIVFRDWEDSTKGTIYYEHLQKGDKNHTYFIELIKNKPDFLNSIKSDSVFMDIDNESGLCNGIVHDRKDNSYKLCKNRIYFRDKCNTHLYQKTN